MTRAQKHLLRIAALGAGALPSLALAHHGSGETSSFAAGMLHPASGIEHIAGFIVAGMLAARLGGRFLWPMTAAFLGLLVAAWTGDSEGWQYAAGFMFASAGLVAAGVATTGFFMRSTTAAAPRSPTSAASAAPAHRPCARR